MADITFWIAAFPEGATGGSTMGGEIHTVTASASVVLHMFFAGMVRLVRDTTGLELSDQVATFWAWHDGGEEAPGSAL